MPKGQALVVEYICMRRVRNNPNPSPNPNPNPNNNPNQVPARDEAAETRRQAAAREVAMLRREAVERHAARRGAAAEKEA